MLYGSKISLTSLGLLSTVGGSLAYPKGHVKAFFHSKK